jgi:hypothetical protein
MVSRKHYQSNEFATRPLSKGPGSSLIRKAAIVFGTAWPLLGSAHNDVAQWSVHEISLTTAESDRNAYSRRA